MPLLRAVRTKSAFSTSSTAGARGARQQRHRPDAQRDGGQDQMTDAAIAIAEARQPFELQGEEIHQHQARTRTATATGRRSRRTIDIVSTGLPGFSAAKKPNVTPTAMAKAMAAKTSFSDGQMR